MRNATWIFPVPPFLMVLVCDWVHDPLGMIGFGYAFLLSCSIYAKGGRP